MPSHKNIEVNQSVFGSYLWVSFSQSQSAGSYFAMFLFAGFYCNARLDPILMLLHVKI